MPEPLLHNALPAIALAGPTASGKTAGALALAGAFGGVTGALILAVVGDVIPEHRRGAAMGMVMSAFSLANICGVPLGLILASHFNWHVPFFVLAGLSVPSPPS